MKFTDEIKITMIKKGINHSELARRLDTSSQNLTNKMKADNWRLSDLGEIAKALDSELVVKLEDKTKD